MARNTMEVELENVCLHETRSRSVVSKVSAFGTFEEDDVVTAFGTMHITIQGDRGKPAILTYHDIGLNSAACFQGFFSYPDMQPLLKHFSVYHVNAPGQQDNAAALPVGLRHSESEKLLQQITDSSLTAAASSKRASLGVVNANPVVSDNYAYPSMDQLAEMLLHVLSQYRLRSVFGFGVGAGANILARFALTHPEKMDGLVLINCTSTPAGWIEWGYQKWNTWYLKSGQLTTGVEDYLIWHWFGSKTTEVSYDLLMSYMDYMRSINPQNLGYFIDSYIRRTDLGIVRELDMSKKDEARNFKCPVMLVVGDTSAHVNDTVEMNSRMNPANSTWIKFECSGMVLEEVPGKMCQAFLLFLQGLGYVPTMKLPKATSTDSMSMGGASGGRSSKRSSYYQVDLPTDTVC